MQVDWKPNVRHDDVLPPGAAAQRPREVEHQLKAADGDRRYLVHPGRRPGDRRRGEYVHELGRWGGHRLHGL